MKADLHTHTYFSDGKDSPEDMVRSAIEKGLSVIGLSDHSYTPFDLSYCVPEIRVPEYRRTVLALKRKYAGQIDVRLGTEQDYFAGKPTEAFEYLIGSAHYIHVGNRYFPVDEDPAIVRHVADKYFGGDMLSVCENYFSMMRDVIARTGADIVGHFDLIRKFNADGSFFDERAPRYKNAVIDAADALLAYHVPFEINTGAISRGYRTDPYPSKEMTDYLRERGATFLPASDSHRKENVAFAFDLIGEERFALPAFRKLPEENEA